MSSPIRRILQASMVLAICLGIGACSNLKKSLGMIRSAPDEFNVVARAPLGLPESLDEFPEPRPGAARPQELEPTAMAQHALFGGLLSDGNRSNGEVTLIAAANMHALEPREYLVIEPGTSVSPEIRQQVDDEHLYILNDSSWIEDINPVTAYGDPTEVLIDVAAERQRLQTNAALGRPASFGPFEGYIVVEEEKALLEDIF